MQPVVAYLVARFALGLEGLALLAVTVTAALPTAQNIFIHATRYDRAVITARDAIFVTTILSVPALVVVAGLLAWNASRPGPWPGPGRAGTTSQGSATAACPAPA